MSNTGTSKFWSVLCDIIFPKCCLACNISLKGCGVISFCHTCREGIRYVQGPYCTICGKPFAKSAGETHLCSYCLKNRWHFSKARAVVCYEGPVVEALKTFKYYGRMYGLETFATLTFEYFQPNPLPRPDLILPVPLHVMRLRKRGFNQALVLSRKLFPQYRKIIDPYTLIRHKRTTSQTGLNGKERRRNVKNAFKVKRPDNILNKKILLVDDVFTTGATVN
jgi:ComF family protein